MPTKTNNSSKRFLAPRMLKVMLGVLAGLLIFHISLQYLNLEVFYQQNGQVYELSNRFDLDDESSVPTWFSQLLLLLIGSAALLAAYLQPTKSLRRLWGLIAVVGFAFSLDEIAGLHEYVLQTLHVLFFQDASPTGSANAWGLVIPFVLVAAGWLLWKMLRLLPGRTVRLMAVAGVTFLIGAVAVDLLASLAPRETFLNQGVMVALEESLELLGSIIALYAIVEYLETHYHQLFSNLLAQIRSVKT